MTVYIISAVAVLILIFIILIYNKLLRLKTFVTEAWSGIDVQLKLRYDLIPQLVEAIKHYANFESGLLTDVAKLRTQAMATDSISDKSILEKKISQNLSNIFVAVEGYPDIKSNENFIKLQDNLVKVEDTIQLARRYYNGAVRNYTIGINSFPNNIIAKLFGYKDMPFFEAEENARADVKVDLN